MDSNTTKVLIGVYDFAADKDYLLNINSLFKRNNLYVVDHDDAELMMSRFFVVAIIDQKLIAALEARFEEKTCLKIINFCVDVKLQNKQIGSEMLRYLERHISKYHKKVNKISCIAGNNSKAFYEKHDYKFNGMFHNKLVSK